MVTKKYCWLMLLLAIILEITGTALMKFFAIKGGMEGYILMLLFIFCSYFALSKAIVKIPISTAYAIWEGIGLIGTATVFIKSFSFYGNFKWFNHDKKRNLYCFK